MLYRVILFAASFFMISAIPACDGVCDDRPDLVTPLYMPNSFNGQEFIVVHSINTEFWIGPYQFFPIYQLGSVTLLPGAFNEFFSLVRYYPNGTPVQFYWNKLTSPPFSAASTPPFHPIQVGEEVKFHYTIFNIAPTDFDCLFKDANSTRVVARMKFTKDQGVQSLPTHTNNFSGIPSGGYQVTSIPIRYQGNGEYEFEIEVDPDNEVDERDISNNTFVARYNNLNQN